MLEILGEFALLALTSMGVGLFFGLLASFMLKKMRFITVSSIKESIIVFCMGYVTYSIGELLHVSGIICLLVCGITMAHYGWYNLSPQGKTITSANI
jgi:NhaP-type Na+/H+ or K+/H+ antiporter